MLDERFKYTQNMDAIFQEKQDGLKSYYCREDLELALSDYDCAPKDARKSRFRDVVQLCRARGIDADKLIADRSILEQIPTRAQMQDRLLQSFYDTYRQAPATSDLMERIVHRLAPEYDADTVRVAILKKFIVGAGDNFKRFHIDSITAWARARLNQDEVSRYEEAEKEEKMNMLLSKIDDSIFEHESIELTVVDVLKLITDRIEKYTLDHKLDFDGIELSEKSQEMLNELVYKVDAGEEENADAEEQLRMLNQAVQKGIVSRETPDLENLVNSVEKDFRNQLKTIKRISKTGKAGTAAELYKQAKKDAVKAKKAAIRKYDIDLELIELCNDLAAGNFRVNGKTKVYLYYFAFMFGMTVPMEDRDCASERNIVTNLFQDFYNDNFLRLLSADYTDPGTASSLEKEPTGEGINYKSFVEMIYLYFLCRDDLNMMPGEKIDRAEEIISECVKRARKETRTVSSKKGIHTEIYRDLHMNMLLDREVNEVADYILEHYEICSPDHIGSARIMVASEENTASDLIDEIMDELDDAYLDIDLFDIHKRATLTKEIKDDMAFGLDHAFEWKVKSLLEKKYSEDKKFLKVISALDERTHISKGRFNKNDRIRLLMLLHILAWYSSEDVPLSRYKIQSRMEERGIISTGSQRTNAIGKLIEIGFDIRRNKDRYYLGKREYEDDLLNELIQKVSERYYSVDEESELLLTDICVRRLRADKRVTRSELIAIHFNYYIALLDQMEEELDTFPDVFEDYALAINPYLEEARYQPLSTKNIFDMYVVTALYFYLFESNSYM